MIGATTENPYFEVNGALISRSSVFELKSLEKEDIRTLLKRAVYDENKGMGSFHAEIDEDALEFLADVSGGDARSALNAIELGVLTTERSEDGKIHITLDVASECIQKRVVRYDKGGDNHYDTISAFIKSMRDLIPMLQCIIWQNAVCRRRYQIYCPDRSLIDLCSRGCGKCRSYGAHGGCLRSTGSGADRDAGGTDYFIASSTVCGDCAKK